MLTTNVGINFFLRVASFVSCVGCVMDMRHPDGERVKNVYLPRGSLLIMEGAARYEWSHGIASRKTDMVRQAHQVLQSKFYSSDQNLQYAKTRRAASTCARWAFEANEVGIDFHAVSWAGVCRRSQEFDRLRSSYRVGQNGSISCLRVYGF